MSFYKTSLLWLLHNIIQTFLSGETVGHCIYGDDFEFESLKQSVLNHSMIATNVRSHALIIRFEPQYDQLGTHQVHHCTKIVYVIDSTEDLGEHLYTFGVRMIFDKMVQMTRNKSSIGLDKLDICEFSSHFNRDKLQVAIDQDASTLGISKQEL
jgi:hypothetical protein